MNTGTIVRRGRRRGSSRGVRCTTEAVYRMMVSVAPLLMRFASHVMAMALSLTQPCEAAVPSAPDRLWVPWMPTCPGPPSNS